MHIPNPYESKHYTLLILIPLVLLGIALFFIPQIPQGIDLRGGQLITIFTDDAITASELEDRISDLNPSSVRSFESPSGKGLEIELPVDDDFARAEETLSKMNSLYDSFIQAEIAGSDSSALREQVLEKARELVSIISPGSSLSSSDPTEAVQQAQNILLDAKSQQREKISQRISQEVNVKESSFKEVGSSLSKFFFSKVQEILIWSF